MDELSILVVGIGGYGKNYLNGLLDYKEEKTFIIKGVVDPKPEACDRLNEVKERNIPVFSSIEDFYNRGGRADLVLISSPIQFHCSQTCTALSNGSNVLCEKPVAATIQDAEKMIEYRDKFKKILGIGFQWSYSSAILDLKRDIMNGLFGKPKRFKTMILWPRNYSYYDRGWAAKIKDKQGNWILDSIANNATAHYLHNMFFVLGDKIDSSAKPLSIKAEVYRANKIENFDTAIIKAYTDKGVELMYYATHAVKELLDPIFEYEFENAVVTFDKNKEKNITAVFKDGTKKLYGDPDDNFITKLWTVMDAVKVGGGFVPCSVEAAESQLICINAIQDAVHKVPCFPEYMIVEDENLYGGVKGIYVKELNEVLKECYKNSTMPSEVKIPWAIATDDISLNGYNHFRGWRL